MHASSPRTALLIALVAASCTATDEPDVAQSIVIQAPARLEVPAQQVDTAFAPALTSIAEAIEAGEDGLARGLLEAVLQRQPTGRALEVAEGFRRILDGREVVAGLDLRLFTEPVPDAQPPGSLVRVLLSVGHRFPERVDLALGPATLSRTTTVVELEPGAIGDGEREVSVIERHGADRVNFDVLSDLRLEPDTTRVIELTVAELVGGRALAIRDLWRFAPRAGHVVRGGESLPAQDVHAAVAEHIRLAPWLPASPLPPEELVAYVEREHITAPPLMERTVRIPLSRRADTLELLAAKAPELGDERLEELVPALRWLARTTEPGGDARAWRTWLEGRRAGGDEPDTTLDLPTERAQ